MIGAKPPNNGVREIVGVGRCRQWPLVGVLVNEQLEVVGNLDGKVGHGVRSSPFAKNVNTDTV